MRYEVCISNTQNLHIGHGVDISVKHLPGQLLSTEGIVPKLGQVAIFRLSQGCLTWARARKKPRDLMDLIDKREPWVEISDCATWLLGLREQRNNRYVPTVTCHSPRRGMQHALSRDARSARGGRGPAHNGLQIKVQIRRRT